MKTIHLITIVILCITLLSSSMVIVTMPQRAYASDCGIKETTLTIPQFYRVSDAVFVGTISSIQSYANHQWIVKFDTEKIWKGTPSPKITIITGNIQACGYSLVEGEKYLIFANGSPLDYISWFSRPYADAQADIAIFDDPQFQAQEKYKEELNKKLEAAKDAISNLMGSRMGDIPFNMVGVDVINSTLDVGIDSTKATLSEEAYLKKIKEIVGDIPIKITFGQIVADVGDSSNNIPRKDLPSFLLSPLKQFKSGIKAEDVKCNSGLILVIKLDYSPACVKLDTAYMLTKRGWAYSELAYPEGDAQFALKTNSTIIPGHLPRHSGVRIPYSESSRIINYTGFDGVYNVTLMFRGTPQDYVLKPGTTGTITFKIEAKASELPEQSYPIPLPKYLNLTNYAVFYHEITSIKELAKYPGVTISDYEFKTCFTRPVGEGTCMGGQYDGKNPIEAYVVDHPGVNILFEPPSEVLPLGTNTTSQIVTIMISADSDAPQGTYLVELSPSGEFLLTVGEKPYHE